jgi:ornithine cyclodeaminase/alanine dehydrogenase-like protein (mu-crystallin family)
LIDFTAEFISSSRHILVDDWQQNANSSKVFGNAVRAGIIDRNRVLELSSVLFNDFPSSDGGRIFVNPIGLGCEDIYVASKILNLMNGETRAHTVQNDSEQSYVI